MHRFSDVINLWQTAELFGRAIGVSGISARTMRRRDSISAKYWTRVEKAALEIGRKDVTAALLASFAARRIGKSQRQITRTRSQQKRVSAP